MDRIWLSSYQPGVAADISPDEYASLNQIFAESFHKYSDLPAFTNMGQTITYAELEQQSRSFAAYIQNTLKIAKGERIALMLPNLLQYPVALLGVLRAGCVAVNVNPLYTPDELEHQLNDSQAVCIVVLENFAHTVAAAVSKTTVKHVIVTKISDVFAFPKSLLVNFVIKYIKKMVPNWKITNYIKYSDVLSQGALLNYKDPGLVGEDIAFLQYTGGTTGHPKGAILTHRNMVANLLQASEWLSQTIEPKKEIIITALPLYHIFSLTANCLIFMKWGALNVLITNPRDMVGFIKEMKKYKFTAITGVNTLYNLMLNHPLFATIDFSALKVALGGGMAVQKVIAERWEKITGTKLLEAYGLTETSPAVCINPMNIARYNGSVGLPISSTDISVRDENNNELPVGEAGELLIKGPQVMRGYWQQPEETNKVLTNDGWLRTGDIVEVDAKGFVRIVDRKKDVINISGFKVFPNEIEDTLAALPGVLEVAVVGAPDDAHGEIVKAFIVKRDPNLTEDDVLKYCHEHLTPYKVPKVIVFRDSLPKTNIGKILRRALK